MRGKEVRVYEVTAEVREHYKSDGNGGRVKVAAATRTELVEISIEWTWLAKQIGDRAIQNVGKKASSMAGAVSAKVVRNKGAKP